MKLSQVITDSVAYDLTMRLVPENGMVSLQEVKNIAQNGALIAAAAFGVSFEDEATDEVH